VRDLAKERFAKRTGASFAEEGRSWPVAQLHRRKPLLYPSELRGHGRATL